ncbi:MAG: dihydropyrimidinase [Firmicutes bacterium]|nr:dihydropyrimidinase [Bacillota bacterium]
MDYLIRGGLVTSSAGQFAADIHVSQGVIKAIDRNLAAELTGKTRIIPAEGKYVFPGGIDAHVHFGANSRGFTSADDYVSGGVAAAAGGTTTIIDMVPQRRGISLGKGLDQWREKACDAVVDYSLHPIVSDVTPVVLDELPSIIADGYSSLKVFLGTNDKQIDDYALLSILEVAGKFGAPVLISAGNSRVEKYFTARLIKDGKSAVEYFPRSRPNAGEVEGTFRAIHLAELVGAPIYFTHVSCGEALEQIAVARARGLSVFGETCPHYLLLSSDRYRLPNLEAAKFVVNPPLREACEQAKLWSGLGTGVLQVVSSDHCPFKFAGQKALGRTFEEIPTGLPGIETRLTLLYSFGVGTGKLSLGRFVDLVAEMPAKLFGLYPKKGKLAVGADADLIVFDPEERVELSPAVLHQNIDYSPYEGLELRGYPVLTMLRGEVIVERGKFLGRLGYGRFVPRNTFQV